MQAITLHFGINGQLMAQMSPENIFESAKHSVIFADTEPVDFTLYPYVYGGNHLPELKDFETYSFDSISQIVSTKNMRDPLTLVKQNKISEVNSSLQYFIDRNVIIKDGGKSFKSDAITPLRAVIENKINTGETVFSIRSLNKTVDIQNISLDTLLGIKKTIYKLLENIYLKHAQTIAIIKNAKILSLLEEVDTTVQIFDKLDGFNDGSITIDITGQMAGVKYINLATNVEVEDVEILAELLNM